MIVRPIKTQRLLLRAFSIEDALQFYLHPCPNQCFGVLKGVVQVREVSKVGVITSKIAIKLQGILYGESPKK